MMTKSTTLLDLYQAHLTSGIAMAAHLPTLRELSEGCRLAVEFGVKRGASTTALLLGAEEVMSYDVVETAEARALELLAGDRWQYVLGDSRLAEIPSCDLLFVDSLHTYAQVRDELSAHADKVRWRLVFHDTITFGSIGAKAESGEHLWTYRKGQSVPLEALGIRPAIDELLIRDPSWRIVRHDAHSHGLLVLERRG